MKNIAIILSIIVIFSCSSKKVTIENSDDIINDFLTIQLKTDRYISYKNLEVFVIEEALKKTEALAAYEFNYNNKDSWGKGITNWALDSLQIQKWKAKLENEKQYHWKTDDFEKIKVIILNNESFENTIKKGDFAKIPPRLILFISTPLIIGENNALISFAIGNSQSGFGTIERFTVLMKKHDGKWVRDTYFFNGQMH